jgi:hypothetical protein
MASGVSGNGSRYFPIGHARGLVSKEDLERYALEKQQYTGVSYTRKAFVPTIPLATYSPIVLDVCNLIGDFIYLIKPLKMFIGDRQDIRVEGVGIDNFQGQMLERAIPGVLGRDVGSNPKRVSLGAGAVHARFTWLHLQDAYARTLELNLEGDRTPDTSWVRLSSHPKKEWIGIAPFSLSSNNRHSLSASQWQELLPKLEPYRIIGHDRLSYVPVERHFKANNLDELMEMMSECRMIFSIDTGIAHVASAMGLKTLVLWATGLHTLAPDWGKNTKIIMKHNHVHTIEGEVKRMLNG